MIGRLLVYSVVIFILGGFVYGVSAVYSNLANQIEIVGTNCDIEIDDAGNIDCERK